MQASTVSFAWRYARTRRSDAPADPHKRPFRMTRKPVRSKIGEGRTIAVEGDVYHLLATGKETDGKYALIEAIVPPGGGPPPHSHSREEEGFYVLEGELRITVDGEPFVAHRGDFVNLPIGSLHSFTNATDKPA